ncbi:hypothetical protein [Pseudomonas sp. Gutcm_11s]|uniref:hypothetical protein n=1 Tax=Pseudomonas sp. Gutcm_11s TaxID=3026088 RepID=UPI002360080D|nr:hypothetical protein [Pseudomonas sp. Gutcm_11s]MDD0843515.1 hypothetical protein [Pseudomonas sp. Gutcm_11s]
MPDVRIERREHKGQPLWLVSLGKRSLSFHEELAARTFAAQLHQRFSWLRQQLHGESSEEHS